MGYRVMGAADAREGADDIADRLHALLKNKRIARIDIDVVRAACSAYLFGRGLSGDLAPVGIVDLLEELTLRRVVERVG